MNKIHLVLLAACAFGCRPSAAQDAAAPDEASDAPADDSGYGAAALPQARVIDFDGEQYSLQRAYVRGSETVNEYFRAGDSAAAWRQWIRVTDSRGSSDLKAFVKAYTDSLKGGLAINKDVYDYGSDSMIVSSDMVAADHIELAMLRAVLIPNMGIRSYLFIKRVPSAEKPTPAERAAKRDIWMSQITKLNAPPSRTVNAVVPPPSM